MKADTASEQAPIADDFAAHTADAAAWLSGVVDGNAPRGASVPAGDDPLDYLIAVLRTRADRELWRALAEAAGELLACWLDAHAEDPNPTEQALQRVSQILSILEQVPAPPSASARLFWMCKHYEFKGVTVDRRDIWRQALLALALSPPLDGIRLDDLAALFTREMRDPPYVVAAFTGLRRLSLDMAVEQVPVLLNALRQRGLPPDQPLRSLFQALEAAPEHARRLGQHMASERALGVELERTLLEALGAPARFPTAWAAFQEGFHASPVTSFDDDMPFVTRLPVDSTRIARGVAWLKREDARFPRGAVGLDGSTRRLLEPEPRRVA